MRSSSIVALIVAMSAWQPRLVAPPPSLTWSGLAAGSHAVGFSVVALPDGRGRLLVWRPVQVSSEPMALGAFVDLVCPSGRESTACTSDLLAGAGRQHVDVEAMKRLSLSARAGGRPRNARHPVVLVVGSIDARGGEFLSQAEALASQGFVVAEVVPAPGEGRRGFTVESAEEATARARLALAALDLEADADTTRIGVIAWSFGGVPALMAASRDPRIVAIVSLDSALRYQYGRDLIAAAGTDVTQVRAEVYSLAAGVDNSVAKDDSVLRALATPGPRVVAAALSHADFSDHYGAWPAMAGPTAVRAGFRRQYAAAIEPVLDFLRRRLDR